MDIRNLVNFLFYLVNFVLLRIIMYFRIKYGKEVIGKIIIRRFLFCLNIEVSYFIEVKNYM